MDAAARGSADGRLHRPRAVAAADADGRGGPDGSLIAERDVLRPADHFADAGAIAVAVCAGRCPSQPVPGSDRTPGAGPGRSLIGSSTNWSGYVSAVRTSIVTCVEASWVEPRITCPAKGERAVAIWIGIDGFSSREIGVPFTTSLVQIGTQANCREGVAFHDAWHEILPAEQHEVRIPARIQAGDHLSARILFSGGRFTMSLYDAEAAGAFTLTASAPGAPRRTAEWIVEAPAVDCPGTCASVALPRFGFIQFTNAHATIGGSRAAIDDDRWTHVKMTMTRQNIVRTRASALTSGGTRFHVTWVHS